jgi:hypothetical protein
MIRSGWRLLFLVGAAPALFPACGAGSVVGPGLSGQQSLITEGSQSGIPPFLTSGGAAFVVVVKTTVSGTLEGSVDWTFASNPVNIAWARGDCQQNPTCGTIAENKTTAKPKIVSAVNASAGTYSLVVVNAGTGNESVSYRIILTP